MKVLFEPFPVIETERVLLQKPDLSDAQNISLLRSEPLNSQFLLRDQTMSLQQAHDWLIKIINNLEEQRSILWMIRDKADLGFAGTICLWNFSDDKSEAELGYELFPAYQGKGIMTEAVGAVLQYAATLQLRKVEAYTQKNNLASINLLLRKQFKLIEGKVDPDNLNNLVFEYIIS